MNAQKTEVLIFTCARIKPKDMPNRLLIVNSRINFGQTVKYLGVTLDLLIGLNTSITKLRKLNKRFLPFGKQLVRNWDPSQPI